MSRPVSHPDDATLDDAALIGRLGELRVDAPDEAFRASLHLRLAEAGAPDPGRAWQRLRDLLARHPGVAWPSLGVAAGVATFALLTVVRGPALIAPSVPATVAHVPAAMPHGPASPAIAAGDVVPTYAVPAAKVAVIRLNFSAEVAVEDVTFEVELPEGLVFWSKGQALAERTFRWPGRLDAGDNLLPIAVRGEHPGQYRVRARAEVGGEIVEHEVMLAVGGDA